MAERQEITLSPGYIKMFTANGAYSQDMDDQASSLQEKITLLERDNEALKRDKEMLQTEVQTTHEMFEDFKQETDIEKKRLNGELTLVKKHRKYLQGQTDKHKHETEELQERILYLEKLLEKKEQQLKASPDQLSIAELQDRAEYLENKVSELQAEKMAYLKDKETSSLQEKVQTSMKLREEVSQRDSEILRLSAYIEGMQRELANLQQLVEIYPKQNTSDSDKEHKPHPQARQKSTLPRQSSDTSVEHRRKGNRLSKFFRLSHIYTTPPSPPPAPPKLVNFNWEREFKSAPRMTRGTTIVDENNSICYFSSQVSPKIHVYHIDTRTWNKLTNCPHLSFGMAIVNGCLTAVGGEKGCGPTGDLISYVSTTGGQEWTEIFPPMTVQRSSPSAVTSEKCLIVVGGVTQQIDSKSLRPLSSVEIMNIDTLQWSQVTPLPIPAHSLSLAVCTDNKKLYLLGGEGMEQSAFVCNIPKLISSQAVHRSHTPQQQHKNVWRQLKDVPTAYATCTIIHGYLVAFGGIEPHKGRESSNGVYAYYDGVADCEEWQHTGLLPTPRSRPLVASLPEGKVIVVGGFTRVGMLDIEELATVEDGKNLRAGSM